METPLQQLGAGGAGDRLHFRFVLQIFGRCFHLLKSVRGHVLLLSLGFAGLALLLLPFVLIFLDTLWTRVFQGQALTELEAGLFGFDPARTVHVASLTLEIRQQVAERAVWFAAAMAALAIPSFVGLWYYQVWILQRINQNLRLDLLDRLQALSLRFHSESRVGDAIYRLYQDSAMVTQLIDLLILQPVFQLGRFVVNVGVVALYSGRLAVGLLLVVPPLWLLTAWLSQPLRHGFRRAREANSALTSRIQETLSGIRVIKAYGAEPREQARFEQDSRAAFSAAYAARVRFAFFGVALFWIAALAMLGGYAMGALQTRAETALLVPALGFTFWNLGLFNNFKERFGDGARASRSLFRTWGMAQDVAIGLDRVFEILDLEPEVQDAADAVSLGEVREGVRFRSVSFAYGDDRSTLEAVDLEARRGTITAIVGPTGSGKTTLMALLLRLFEPQAGGIEIDGVDLRRLRIASLRSKVAIALQENLLFGTTVRENIRYARPTASDAEVREAARVACADRFVEALPEGFDTRLGERGAKLSTGQRQRLSIARAVIKDAPILILDEPTASLDAETELEVLDHLVRWGKDRVILLVTHRLSTIRRADQILVLEEGRAVECGSPEELLRRPDGAYRQMVESEGGAR